MLQIQFLISLAAPNLQPNKIDVHVNNIAVFNCSIQDAQCNENNCESTRRRAIFETDQFSFDHTEYIEEQFSELSGNYNISCSCNNTIKTFSLHLRAFHNIADFVPYIQCIEEQDSNSGRVRVYSQTALLQLLPYPSLTCATLTVTVTSTIQTTVTRTIQSTPTPDPRCSSYKASSSSSSQSIVLSALLPLFLILFSLF